MIKCSICNVSKDDSGFFPNQKWPKARCISCVKQFGGKRKIKFRKKVERANREQEALLLLVKQFQKNKEPYVYLIDCHHRQKIGFSTNIEKRIKTFNTASPFPAILLAVAPGDIHLEHLLHEEFDSFRIFGEWFIARDRVIDKFSRLDGSMVFLPGFMKS